MTVEPHAPPPTGVSELPPPARSRLAELARLYGLSDTQVAQLATLLDAISADPLAPTTVRDLIAAVDQHVADSLVALELEAVRGARTAADVGSGAGLPGLALAVAVPDCRWWLLESVKRKVAFVERTTTRMGVGNAVALNLRAEEWREGLRSNDLVTARAVAPAPVVLEYAAPLLRLGATLVDWRTQMSPEEEAEARAAAATIGLERAEARPVLPFAGAHSRYLYVYVKVRDTPERFPRRPGSARKRPLGSSARG
jgi:16S rRNA (guanine527-N7)-methyltransferase